MYVNVYIEAATEGDQKKTGKYKTKMRNEKVFFFALLSHMKYAQFGRIVETYTSL